MKKLLIGLIRGYQRFISPLFPPRCRFYPTCSQYALEAVQIHGAAKGSWLGFKRVCRCHPWGGSGVDFVPQKPQPATVIYWQHLRYEYLPPSKAAAYSQATFKKAPFLP